MRIVIDARDILNPEAGVYAGVSHYVDGITRALLRAASKHEFVIFFRPEIPPELIERTIGGHPRAHAIFLPARRGFFMSHIRTATLFKAARPDILFAPSGQLPAGWMGRSVLTAHDLSIFEHPEWFPEPSIGQMISTKFIVPASFRKATGVICVSEATRTQVQKQFCLPERRLRVIPEAVEAPKDFSPSPMIGRFILFIGTLEPRKNLSLLLNAFDRILQETHRTDITLAIAGKRGWKCDEIIQLLEALKKKYGSHVCEFGYVTQEEKWALLKNADVFVFPSLDEGFGLPVLEAMSVCTPVVTTKNGGLPEVAGQAVRYVSAEDPRELATALQELLASDEARRALGEHGRKQALLFDWGVSAERTLRFFEEMC